MLNLQQLKCWFVRLKDAFVNALCHFLKCLWGKNYYVTLIWKAFQSEEGWRLLFSNILFHSKDIQVFCIMQIRNWWRHKWLQHGDKSQNEEYLKKECMKIIDNWHQICIKKEKMGQTLLWQQSWPQSVSALNQILPFVTLQRDREGPVQCHIYMGIGHVDMILCLVFSFTI